MKLDCQFRNLDYSQSLVDYAEERVERVEKYLVEDAKIYLTISKKNHMKHIDINIQGANFSYKAKAHSNDFYVSVDLALSKLKKQMIKKKDKIKHHKNYEKSHMGRLDEYMKDEIEWWQKVG